MAARTPPHPADVSNRWRDYRAALRTARSKRIAAGSSMAAWAVYQAERDAVFHAFPEFC